MTGADALLDMHIDTGAALRRELERHKAALRALLADPQSTTAREQAKDVLR